MADVKYYPINEGMARRAKDMNSYFDYEKGSATASYRRQVDEVAALAERKKNNVDSEYHEKIDYYVDLYARKLAENLNKGYEIDTRCPSILVAGGSNFPVRKKEKQNAARDKNYKEYDEIQGIIKKIQAIGTGGIKSDDKNAIEKLEKKLADLERNQERMKQANKAIRMKDVQAGDSKLHEMGFTDQEIKELREPDFCGRIGFADYLLTNNNANIRRIRERIADLKKEVELKENPVQDQKYDGFTLHEDPESCRIQFLFDDKPDEETRKILKSYGFRWSPSKGVWQRMLNDNGRSVAQIVIKAIT